MTLYILIFLAMTISASFASFFLKKSTSCFTILSIIFNKYLYIGGLLYIIAASCNIWLLKRLPYSIVVPFGSVNYIWTMFIAGIYLKEKINIRKVIGTLLIVFGVICIIN